MKTLLIVLASVTLPSWFAVASITLGFSVFMSVVVGCSLMVTGLCAAAKRKSVG